jgi:hypothetical protein
MGAFCSKNATKNACPAGMRDDGTSCWLDTYGNGAGGIPNVSCPSATPSQRGIGAASWCDNGPTWPWDLKTSDSIKSCPAGQTMIVGLCYNNCKAGYHFAGGNLCEPDGGPGIKQTLDQRSTCGSSSPSTKPKLGICTITKDSYGRGVGDPDTTIITKDSYGRGAGDPDTTIITKDSYGRGVGDPDTKIIEKSAAIGRGVGTPAVQIRAKNRIVEYSTKQNAMRMVSEGYNSEKTVSKTFIGVL